MENASLEDGYWADHEPLTPQQIHDKEDNCQEKQTDTWYKHRTNKTTESLSMFQTYLFRYCFIEYKGIKYCRMPRNLHKSPEISMTSNVDL